MTSPDVDVPVPGPEKPKFLRSIAFLDHPNGGGDMPVHLAQRVLLDGVQPPPHTVHLSEGWSVGAPDLDGTVVSFCVRADHITPPVIEGGVHVVPPKIFGRSVLCPIDPPWEEFQPSNHPTKKRWYDLPKLVRVYIYVDTIEIRRAAEGEIEYFGPYHERPVDAEGKILPPTRSLREIYADEPGLGTVSG
jgi:hypothetical protein